MSRVWFALAVAAVLGLFYVGAGLHSGPAAGAANGQEVDVKPLFGQPAEPLTMKWETLSSSVSTGSRGVYRSKIAGGWLVELRRTGTGIGLAFVPDPEHQWDGSSLP